MSITPEKKEALNILLKSYEKSYGKGTIQTLSGDEVTSIERSSSGIASIDAALGGGYAKGRIHELYGPESSGKTTLLIEALIQVQKDGGIGAFIDAEQSLDLEYAQGLGLDIDSLIFAQPESAEQALNIATSLVESGLVDMIVIDSVAALTPQKELDGEIGDSTVGLLARLMGQSMRKIKSSARKNNVVVIFINQIRMKIGVMFGSPETTPGGKALQYFASIRMDIRRTGTKKVGEESVANETKITIKKNKTAPPFRTATFEIEFGTGINKTLDLLRLAVSKGIVEKSGAWYSYEGERISQGERNACSYLNENDQAKEVILARLKTPLLEGTNGISTRDDDV